jgi:hypothetical protein
MAQGDAMVLQTANLTVYGGMDTDGGGGVATGWTADVSGTATKTTTIDTSVKRTGAGSQKIVAGGGGSGGDVYIFLTAVISLLGRSDLNGYGHYGSLFHAEAYFKAEVGGKYYLRITELTAAGADIADYDSDVITAAGTDFTLATWEHAIANATCAKVRVLLACRMSAAESKTFYIDDVSLYETYTFSKNPSMPEQADVDRETKQSRLANRTLKSFTYPASGYKFSGKLAFGLISEAQMLALRSLWIWDKELTFTPNLNKLPSSLIIRLGKKFDFNHVSPNLGAGYKGSLEWEEV